MSQTDTIFTATLNSTNVPLSGALNTFSITGAMGIRGLAIKWVSGTVRYKGNLAVNGIGSSYLALADGAPFSFSSNLSVDGFTIDVTNGVCEISLIK
mgnify:CR=1 FL=1